MWCEGELYRPDIDYSKPKILYGEQLWENTRTGVLKNNYHSDISAFVYSSALSNAKKAKEDFPVNPLNSILYPSHPSGIELSKYVYQSIYNHIVQCIYHLYINRLSLHGSALKWKTAVKKYWPQACNYICESCVRRTFAKNWYGLASEHVQCEVSDVVERS